MTWYFYDDTSTPWDRIRRGHEVSDPENVALVEAASAAMERLGIGPSEGERFQTMLNEGEVSFASVNADAPRILATQAEGRHPHLELLGTI